MSSRLEKTGKGEAGEGMDRSFFGSAWRRLLLAPLLALLLALLLASLQLHQLLLPLLLA